MQDEQAQAGLETSRLQALRRYEILDTYADETFDTLTRLAAQVLKTSVSFFALVDKERVWFKSIHGIKLDEVARTPGLCDATIQADDVHVVEDAGKDVLARDNPLVCAPFGLRFYAAAPLVNHEGHRLGTLGVMSREPRTLNEEEKPQLEMLASVVMDLLERRLSALSIAASFKALVSASEATSRSVSFCAWSNKIRLGGQWITFEDFLSEHLGWRLSQDIHPDIADEIIDTLK